jgi:hypothetical protein
MEAGRSRTELHFARASQAASQDLHRLSRSSRDSGQQHRWRRCVVQTVEHALVQAIRVASFGDAVDPSIAGLHGSGLRQRPVRSVEGPTIRAGQSSPGSHPRTRKIDVRRDPMAASATR